MLYTTSTRGCKHYLNQEVFQMKKILFVASEAVPFIKTGGLADVVGSLPKCFDKEYFDVRVMIPKYLCIKEKWRNEMTYINHFYMDYLARAAMWASCTTSMRGSTSILLTTKVIFPARSHMGIGSMTWRSFPFSVRRLCRLCRLSDSSRMWYIATTGRPA